MRFVRPQYQDILTPILQLMRVFVCMCVCVCVCVFVCECVSGTANIQLAPPKIWYLCTNILRVTSSF